MNDLLKILLAPLLAALVSSIASYFAVTSELARQMGRIEVSLSYVTERVKMFEERGTPPGISANAVLNLRLDNIEKTMQSMEPRLRYLEDKNALRQK